MSADSTIGGVGATQSIICIDGPSGAGKGTVSRLVAEKLGFCYLDSGALYRVLAVISDKADILISDEEALSNLAYNLHVKFEGEKVIYQNKDISSDIRTEEVGMFASQIATFPSVRESLLQAQRSYATAMSLVADGRDMGTVVFPHAELKIFLTASPEERAKRRYDQLAQMEAGVDKQNDANQLIHKGDGDSLRALVEEIKARDERDSTRVVSPLRPAEDAKTIDSTSMSVEEVVSQILIYWDQLAEN